MAFHLIQAAYAQAANVPAAADAAPAASGLIQILPLLLIGVVMYVLLLRPYQKQQKQMNTARAALKRGDRIVTAGGILGTVQKTRDTEVDVEIAPNVRVTVLRDTIGNVVKPVPAND